jgi:hypothetical protein
VTKVEAVKYYLPSTRCNRLEHFSIASCPGTTLILIGETHRKNVLSILKELTNKFDLTKAERQIFLSQENDMIMAIAAVQAQ